MLSLPWAGIFIVLRIAKMYYIYILTNKNNTVLYTGITNNLERRIYEHKSKLIKWFTSKYNLTKLVYFEEYEDVNDAIRREKQLKRCGENGRKNLLGRKILDGMI